jgi:hypothetical protein
MEPVSAGIGFASSVIAVATLAVAVASTIDNITVNFHEAQDTLNKVRSNAEGLYLMIQNLYFASPGLDQNKTGQFKPILDNSESILRMVKKELDFVVQNSFRAQELWWKDVYFTEDRSNLE